MWNSFECERAGAANNSVLPASVPLGVVALNVWTSRESTANATTNKARAGSSRRARRA
ncbi:MAG TPA: hypothetical protein VME22_14580 [Solirubrobacteraceae bacterium]|nr:hypothetical protein [Solirubrobacteraceae bacterium]